MSGFVYEPENGKLAFQFNPIAKKQFQQRRLYSKLILQIQAPIKSGHTLTLYEYLNDELQRHKGSVENIFLSLVNLRALLDIDANQYPAFKYFNQRVIKPAFQEINGCTDIEAACEFIRENRNVIALSITAKRRENFQTSYDAECLATVNDELERPSRIAVQVLMAYGITQNKAIELAESFSAQQLVAGIKYTVDRSRENKVKNFPSYLIKAINEGYAVSSGENEGGDELKATWSLHRSNRALELFEALLPEKQRRLRESYIDNIENGNSRTIAKDKFKYDGGWNSRYIQNDFQSKVMFSLLKEPIDVDFEAFKAWWPQQELKNLLVEAHKKE